MRKINLNKRVTSAVLAGVMCLQMLPGTAFAIETVTIEEIMPLEQTEYAVDFGTAEKDLPLPLELDAWVVTDSELGLTENATVLVEWEGDYDAYTPGTYTMEASIGSRGYHYEGEMPEVQVTVLEERIEVLDDEVEVSVEALEDLPDGVVGAATEYVGEIINDTTNKTTLFAEHRVLEKANDPVYGLDEDVELVRPQDTEDGTEPNREEPPTQDEEATAKPDNDENVSNPSENTENEEIASSSDAAKDEDNEQDGAGLSEGESLEVPENEVPLAAGPDMGGNDDIAADKWSLNVKYVRQAEPYDITQTTNFTLKYQVNFHTDLDDLAPESVRIEIPAVLYTNREGQKILPNSVGVPEGQPENYTPARNSPFNYYLDGETLVLWNYKEIRKGTTSAVQVLYQTQQIMSIVDMTEWSITPTITIDPYTITNEDTEETIEGSVTAQTRSLTGLVDSKVDLKVVSLNSYTNGGSSYTPGLYTNKQLAVYLNTEVPPKYAGANIQNYFFVVWYGTITGSATQPWTLDIKNIPSAQGLNGPVEGELVGFSWSNGTGTAGRETLGTDSISFNTSSSSKIENKFYIVTAYPNATLRDGLQMKDQIDVTITPKDGIDPVQEKSADATWAYQAYDWKYLGNTIGVTKKVSSSDNLSGWTTAYRLAQEMKEDYTLASFSMNGRLTGYESTHIIDTKNKNFGQYIPGSYFRQMTADDTVYAWDTKNDGTRYLLDDKDYYFSSIKIKSVDKGFDPYEDEISDVTTTSTINRDLDVWAMYAGSSTWERVTSVPWNTSGTVTYTFTSEQLARQPYRVKAYYSSVDYSTTIYIDVTMMIRHNSPKIGDLVKNGSGYVTVENLAAIMGIDNTGFTFHDGEDTIIHSSYDDYETKYNVSARSISRTLYQNDEASGNAWQYPQRYASIVTTAPLLEEAKATKTNTIKNDTTNGRVLIDYTLSSYESYLITNKDDYTYMRINGSLINVDMPERKTVQFYDLLPAGVFLNPDVAPVAGRMKSLDIKSYKDLDASQVKVEISDYISDYQGTGRNMLVFTVTYTGADPSTFSDQHWFQGFGVYFQGYASWEELPTTESENNIMAYIPVGNERLLGTAEQVAKDDGVIVSDTYDVEKFLGSNGKSLFGSDINKDKDTQTRNVMYAASAVTEDFATAYTVGLQKLVKADEDIYNNPSESAIVSYEKGYIYTLMINADEGTKVRDITIFDQIENFPVRNDWQGIFNGVSYDNALRMGATSVTVWYNANRDAVMPNNAGSGTSANLNLNSILTATNGWYRENAWNKPLSEVRAVAMQLNGLVLDSEEAVSVQVHMLAPAIEDVHSSKSIKNTYNEIHMLGTVGAINATAETKFHDGPKTVVSLDGANTVEVVKEFKDINGVPMSLQNNPFEIKLTLTKGETSKAFSYAPYDVYEKQSDDSWKLVQEGLLTSIKGIIELKAGQKAVFQLAGGSYLSAREEESVYWNVEYDSVTDEDTGVSTLTVINAYRPILYITKSVSAVPTDQDISNEEFTFQVMLFDKEQQEMVPAADRTFWKVKKAYTNGIVPTKIGEGTTDSLGQVKLKQGDIIAIFSDYAGQKFSIEETGMSENWICLDNTDDGNLGIFGSNTTVTNYWRWKDLYITKNITNQSKKDALAEKAAFTFEVLDKDGNPVVGNEWILLDDEGNPTNTHGALDEQGRFSAICGTKRVKIAHLAGNETYTVREINVPSNYEPTIGFASAVMPIYSTSKSVSLTNEWLRRDMYVTKNFAASSAPGADTTPPNVAFQFTLMDNEHNILSGKSYTTDSDKSGVTDASGHFYLNCGETACFKDVGLRGEMFYVEETPDAHYPQIYPINNGGTNVLLTDNELNNKATFVNGKDTMLMIRKQWVAKAGDQIAATIVSDINDSTKPSVPLYTANGDLYDWNKAVPLVMTVNGMDWPFEDTEITAIDTAGEIQSVIWKAEEPYWLLPGWTLFITSLDANDEYVLAEADEYRDWWTEFDISGDHVLTHIQATEGVFEGNTATIPTAILVNEVSTFQEDKSQSVVAKLMTEDSSPVPEGAMLTYRAEWYDETTKTWIPSADINYTLMQMEPKFQSQNSSSTTNTALSTNPISAQAYVSNTATRTSILTKQLKIANKVFSLITGENGAYDQNGTRFSYTITQGATDENGLIRIPAVAGATPVLYFDETVTKDGANNTIRLVEVPELTDDAWGELVRYEEIAAENGETQWAFVNSNVPEKLTVTKELSAPQEGNKDEFSFTLERIATNGETEIIFPGSFVDYTICNSVSNAVVGQGNTGANGTISLKAGQYAQIDTARYTKWRITEGKPQTYMLQNITSNATEQETSIPDRSACVLMTDGKSTVRYEATYIGETLAPGMALTPADYEVYKITVDDQGHGIKELVPSGNYTLSVAEVPGADPFVQIISIPETKEKIALSQECLPAYAMFYDDGSLVFQRGNVPETGKVLVESYSGFEDEIYNIEYRKTHWGEILPYSTAPWMGEDEQKDEQRNKIKSVFFKDMVAPISTAYWFYGCFYLSFVDVTKLNSSKVISMDGMFDGNSYWLSEVHLGSKNAIGKMLPTPKMENATGDWYTEDGTSYAPSEIPDNVEAVYYATNPLGLAYAMLYDDGSLVFQRGNEPEAGKTLVKSWTGFEYGTYDLVNHYHYGEAMQCSTAPWGEYYDRDRITSISFKDMVTPISTAYWFYDCYNLTFADITKLDSHRVTNMTHMFSGCRNLSEIHLGSKTTVGKMLPEPSSYYIDGADGKWYTADGTGYEPSDIPDNVEATYYAVSPVKPAYAMLYSDGSMVFQRGNEPGKGKTLVASYTDYEPGETPWHDHKE